MPDVSATPLFYSVAEARGGPISQGLSQRAPL